jgi:hypothetical protein
VGEQHKNLAVMMVGSFNIFAGILTTIAQYLGIAELNESHRISSISWDKFYRNIKVELAKHPRERIQPGQLLKQSKEEFDRLMETSPSISQKVVDQFNKTFRDLPDFDKIKIPDICGTLVTTEKFRYQPDSDDELEMIVIPGTDLDREPAKSIRNFYQEFVNLKHRPPFVEEIYDNLHDKHNITKEQVRDICDQLSLTVS